MAVPKGTPPPNKGIPMSAEQYEKCKPFFFTKGHIPANKGVPMTESQYKKCARTMFTKGHVPHNHKPIGSERTNTDGYVSVKVAEPNQWRQKHYIVWEEAHGPVKPKHIVIFIDGDKSNCNLDNLMMISKSDNAVLNRLHLRVGTKEALEAALVVARLVREKHAKVNRKKKYES